MCVSHIGIDKENPVCCIAQWVIAFAIESSSMYINHQWHRCSIVTHYTATMPLTIIDKLNIMGVSLLVIEMFQRLHVKLNTWNRELIH